MFDNQELVLKILIIAEFTAFSAIRIAYQRSNMKAGRRTVISESRRYAVYLSLFICYEVFTFFAYIFWPQGFSWAQITLPLWVGLAGSAIGLFSLLLFICVHRTLGLNLSASLKIKEEHILIRNGPYRSVRHPMYSAFFLLHIAVLLMTANWFIGGIWMLGLLLIIGLRVRREEEMLLSQFGQEYRSYMEETPRFIPNLVPRSSDGRQI